MNQLATPPKASSPTELSNYLKTLKGQIELALPSHLTANRMCRLALTEFSKNPKLKNCTMQSIAACVMMSSQLGLEIGVNGQAYMIPYGETATFVPGWKGLIDLVNRAGKASVWTGAVFDGDFFEWELGSDPKITHRPNGESDPDKLQYVYAVGRLEGAAFPIIECWPNDRVKKHFKKFNKVGSKHYAHQNWEMYARKIVLLQVLKYLPQSVELNKAITAEYKSENVVSGSVVGSSSGLDRLTESLGQTIEHGDEPAQAEAAATESTTTTMPEVQLANQYTELINKAEDIQAIDELGGQFNQAISELKLPKAQREAITKPIISLIKQRTEQLETA